MKFLHRWFAALSAIVLVVLATVCATRTAPVAAPAPAAPIPSVAPVTRPDPAIAPVPVDASAPITKKDSGLFLRKHESFIRRGKEGPIGVLVLGDSITEGWKKAPAVWEEDYGTYGPANFGIGGDRTQHVIWRIENGEPDGIQPRAYRRADRRRGHQDRANDPDQTAGCQGAAAGHFSSRAAQEWPGRDH